MPGKSKHGKAFKKRKLTRLVQPETAMVAPQAATAVEGRARTTAVQTSVPASTASALAAKTPLSHLISVGTELRTIAVLSLAMILILVILAYILP